MTLSLSSLRTIAARSFHAAGRIGKDGGLRRWFWSGVLAPPALLFALLVAAPVPVPAAESVPTDSLARRAAFLDARLAAAETGAISLSLDLTDSTLVIESGGVPLRRCRVLGYRAGRAAERAYAAGDEAPALFTLAGAGATIPRTPVRTVEAPADTAEAAARPPQEVPKEARAAYATLRFDRGLVVHLRPTEAPLGSRVVGSGHWAKERGESAARTLQAVASSDHTPDAWVEVALAPEDVKAVYRALPDGAALALRLR